MSFIVDTTVDESVHNMPPYINKFEKALNENDIHHAVFLVMDIVSADDEELERWEKDIFIAGAIRAAEKYKKSHYISIH